MNEVRQRIKNLRLEMLKRDLDAWYISGTDPHNSEYLIPGWQTRSFITGFTGSFGIVVVTNEEAGLWTDTRYFLQAPEQLKGSGIKMYKLRVHDAVSPELWLSRKLASGSKVGFDPRTISVSVYRKLQEKLSGEGISLVETPDLFNYIWDNRPEIPDAPVFELETKFAGQSRREKRELIISELKKRSADLQIVTSMDELAWIFNLRGSDVIYNPLFTGYGIVGMDKYMLFVGNEKVPSEIRCRLEKDKVEIMDYNEFYSRIKSLKNNSVMIDPSTTNYAVYKSLVSENRIIEGTSVAALLKARKNPVELAGFREVMKNDGAALTEFLYWLKEHAGNSDITEYICGQKLGEFRSKQEGYMGDSFAPIVGYKEHGAIVHLTVGSEDALPVGEDGILLFDSGGHYKRGTTDITRTVALGNITPQQQKDFTLVLKGVIGLSKAKFPEGTKGCNIDILARKALWDSGLNYGHGTGHGIGHFLNVHEGPMSVRQELNDVPLSPGMVLSNEPGIYRDGEYGIRIENIMVCVEKEETAFGKFLGFETLTLCPVDTSLIDLSLLDDTEKEWLNRYHLRVRNELKPFLKESLHGFLDELTAPISAG